MVCAVKPFVDTDELQQSLFTGFCLFAEAKLPSDTRFSNASLSDGTSFTLSKSSCPTVYLEFTDFQFICDESVSVTGVVPST